MKKLFPIVATLLVLAISGCAPQVDVEADEAAIRNLETEVVAAENAGDADALMTGIAVDAIWLPPNEPALTGKVAIRESMQNSFDQFDFEITTATAEVEVAGDWAFARGTYEFTVTPKAGGEAQQETGKYIWILQRQADGFWKFARAIWNSDLPAGGGE
jgi:uncharacterized protein (TIGR02246 family)